MNRFTKGSIAIGAAAVLLLGGAGSLAYWQQTETIDGDAQSFRTGQLFMVPSTESWTVNGVTESRDDVASWNAVPGTSVSYTRTYDVNTLGENLYATFGASLGGVTATPRTDSSAEPQNFGDVITPSVQISGSGVEYTTTSNVVNITEPGEVTVTITLNWPYGEADPTNTTEFQTISMADTIITLTQVPAPLQALSDET